MTVPKRFQRYGVKYAILQEQEVDWQASHCQFWSRKRTNLSKRMCRKIKVKYRKIQRQHQK